MTPCNNALRQTSQIDLNNGLRTVYNYHGLDAVDGGDPSSFFGDPTEESHAVAGFHCGAGRRENQGASFQE